MVLVANGSRLRLPLLTEHKLLCPRYEIVMQIHLQADCWQQARPQIRSPTNDNLVSSIFVMVHVDLHFGVAYVSSSVEMT